MLENILQSIGQTEMPSRRMKERAQAAAETPRRKLKHALHVVRFVVRARRAAAAWAAKLETRKQLKEALEKAERARRLRHMRDEWRAEVRARFNANEAAAAAAAAAAGEGGGGDDDDDSAPIGGGGICATGWPVGGTTTLSIDLGA